MNQKPYSAGLISQSFWFIETKKLFSLVAQGKTKQEIRELCLNENILGASKEHRAKQIYGYLSTRLSKANDDIISIFLNSDLATQKIVNLYIILSIDRLFFEFLYEVYREKVIIGSETIDRSDVSIFFKNKEKNSESIRNWTDATKYRLSSSYLNFMRDANLISIVNNKKIITPPILDDTFTCYLKEKKQTYYIKAISGEK